MLLSKVTATWPIEEDRPDLAEAWFNYLLLQTREAFAALEAVAHAGVDAELTVQDLLAEVDRRRQQVRFNRSLGTAVLAKREKQCLSAPPRLAGLINEVVRDLQALVDKADNLADFVSAVAKEADFYKTLESPPPLR